MSDVCRMTDDSGQRGSPSAAQKRRSAEAQMHRGLGGKGVHHKGHEVLHEVAQRGKQ